jgi:hypothetical protein
MKKFCILPLVAALAFFVSCQKQQSEEEKKAEVERQVQERLAVERQADEKERLAKQQADLEAREKALADKEAAPVAANVPAETPMEEPMEEPAEEPQPVRRTRDVSETRSTASYGTFYRKLEPYGAWRETNDYGYVWQPREAEDRSWRPYTDGRWVYTDAGWTWISEEPFGWATYHYGRWVRLRRVGWVWVPGEEWAPAWVSWRTSKDYVGWAPLPPEARFDRRHGIRNWADSHYDIGPDQYAFVPNNEFGSRRIRRSVLPVERNVTIVIETTNVTNITYANTTIVNQGPNYEELRSRSQQPIERYRLERQLNSETTGPATVRGDVLVLSAPAITAIIGVDRPQNVKETMTETTVEKTWAAGTDRPAADRARAKMKAEVQAPPDAPSKTFVKPVSSTSSTAPPAATMAPASAAPVMTPTTSASAPPAFASTPRATPAIPTPTPAPITRATPKPASPTAAPTARTTPVTISSPTPSLLASPTPLPTARATPKPVSPIAVPTAASTVPVLSSPSFSASPPARPRHLVSPPGRSPAEFVKPSVSPELTAVPAAPSTPPRVPQTTPRRIVPTPLTTPAVRPVSTPPVEAIAKPSPRHDLAPRPVVSPPMTQPPQVVTPPDETKPVVRQTPAGVRTKAPPDAVAIPPARALPSPPPEDEKDNKRPKRPGSVDGEKPVPTPTASPAP